MHARVRAITRIPSRCAEESDRASESERPRVRDKSALRHLDDVKPSTRSVCKFSSRWKCELLARLDARLVAAMRVRPVKTGKRKGGKKGVKKKVYTTQSRMIPRRVSFFFLFRSVPLNRSSLCGSIIKTCSGFSTGLDDILTGGPRRTLRRTTSHGVVGVFSSSTTTTSSCLSKRQRWSTRFGLAY